MSHIQVTYKVYGTQYHIEKALKELESRPVMSFDTETCGVYPKAERKEAMDYLKLEDTDPEYRKLALLVSNNSGLSFPSLVSVTHFIFGLSETESVVLICENIRTERYVWEWLATYEGLLIVHNALYDLKIMYHRIKKFPLNYEDTQILIKCLINNADVWKSKVSLKDLMGHCYDPFWSLMEDYEPENLRDPKFLMYAAIDGAATVKAWNEAQTHIREEAEEAEDGSAEPNTVFDEDDDIPF